MPKLTKRAVDAAQPDPERDVWLMDSEVVGFGLRVRPSGSRSFFVKYRPHGGTKTRRFTLGKPGSPYTVDQARQRARDILEEVRQGRDPMDAKAEARKALTVADLVDLYLTDGPADKPNKKAVSWRQDESNLRRHVVPLLGRKAVKSLTTAEVAKFQRDVAEGKTAADTSLGPRSRSIVKGGKGTAARALAVLGAMLEWGTRHDRLPHNPAKGVRLYKGRTMERFVSDREAALLADSINILEDMGALRTAGANVFRLLMLTGCRKEEVAGLRWEWVDFGRGVLRLPDSKTGASVKTLGAPALQILSDMAEARDGRPWVFPATRGEGSIQGLTKDWEMVRVFAGVEDVRMHDLRHSFASFAAADNASLYLIGKVLGHRQARTTEKYAHLSDDPVRQVVERTSARIAEAMKLRPRSGGEVVPLKKGSTGED